MLWLWNQSTRRRLRRGCKDWLKSQLCSKKCRFKPNCQRRTQSFSVSAFNSHPTQWFQAYIFKWHKILNFRKHLGISINLNVNEYNQCGNFQSQSMSMSPVIFQDDVAYYSEPEREVPVSRTPKELPRCETLAALPDYPAASMASASMALGMQWRVGQSMNPYHPWSNGWCWSVEWFFFGWFFWGKLWMPSQELTRNG